MCLGYPDGCKTVVEPPLKIKVNCLSTFFMIIFDSDLVARKQLANWNAVLIVVPAAN